MLFTVEGKAVVPHVETLMIPPFKQIWERDGHPNKEVAKQEFTYMEFVTSMKKTNPYRGYPEEQKPDKVREDIIRIENWEADELVLEGIEKIREFQEEASVTYRYYMSAKTGAEKMMDFFEEFDMNTVNLKTLAPIYKPRDITSALNDTSKVLQNLNELKEKVEQELFESTRRKGDKEVGHFAQRASIES